MNQPYLISRRNALQSAGALALAVSALEMAGPLAWAPQRADAATALPDIQFDIAALLTAPPQTSGTGVVFQMPPVHTVFVTGRLERTPTLGRPGDAGRRAGPAGGRLPLQRGEPAHVRVLRDPLLPAAARGADRPPRLRPHAPAAVRTAAGTSWKRRCRVPPT